MGFKSLLLLVSIAFLAIFAFQNQGAIALTFFGFNSPALPLFLWMLLALLAGIISSLLLNVLSSNQTNYGQRNQSFNPPYSPPPPRKEKSNPAGERIMEGLNYGEEEDEVFEDLPDNSVNKVTKTNAITEEIPVSETISEKNSTPETTFTTPSEEKKETPAISLTSNEEREDEEMEARENQENLSSFLQEMQPPETEDSSPNLWKTREACPYSYQTREKTDIRPKTAKSVAKQTPPSPKPKRVYQGIYTAPYRVITPAQDYNGEQNDDFEEDDEDWDF